MTWTVTSLCFLFLTSTVLSGCLNAASEGEKKDLLFICTSHPSIWSEIISSEISALQALWGVTVHKSSWKLYLQSRAKNRESCVLLFVTFSMRLGWKIGVDFSSLLFAQVWAALVLFIENWKGTKNIYPRGSFHVWRNYVAKENEGTWKEIQEHCWGSRKRKRFSVSFRVRRSCRNKSRADVST